MTWEESYEKFYDSLSEAKKKLFKVIFLLLQASETLTDEYGNDFADFSTVVSSLKSSQSTLKEVYQAMLQAEKSREDYFKEGENDEI